MKRRFETCTVALTPLSPIHISAGNPDYGWGAVWLNTQSKLYILDSERFSTRLAEADLLEKYIEAVQQWTGLSDAEKTKKSNPCFEFISNNRKSLYLNTDIESFVKELSINEIAAEPSSRFIRNGNGEAYIPGSSIKGAIRTAVIYAMLQKYKQDTEIDSLNDYLEDFFSGKPSIPKNTKSGFDTRKGMDKELLKSILEEFELTDKNSSAHRRDKPENGSITNLMRAIIVSDSKSIPHVHNSLEGEEIRIVMLGNEDKYGDRTLIQQALPYATKNKKKECLQAKQNISITFRLTIDHEILQSFDSNKNEFPIVFRNLKDLEKIITEFYRKVWKAEEEYYLEQLTLPDMDSSREEKMIENVLDFHDDETEVYPNLQPNINIGLGAGMLCKTLFIAIKPKYQMLIRNLQMTDRQIRNHHRKENGYGTPVNWMKKLAPNSRHLVFRGERKGYRPLGWANLKFGTATYEENEL